jgi:hypothetical protein
MLDLKNLLIALAVGLVVGVLCGWYFTAKYKDATLADNRRLATELGGLRDPGRRPSCGITLSSASTTASQPDNGTTGTELSAEATEFLLEFARSADRAAQYAKTCHDWIQELNRK